MIGLLLTLGALSQAADGDDTAALPLLQVELADVTIKKRFPIEIPAAAAELEIPRVICPTRVYFDPKGRTESVQVVECPDDFHPKVEASVMKWKFKPMRTDEGQPARATFVMTINIPLDYDRINGE
ncbi:MAG: energy transducer TonB [Myxococcota bacterium]